MLAPLFGQADVGLALGTDAEAVIAIGFQLLFPLRTGRGIALSVSVSISISISAVIGISAVTAVGVVILHGTFSEGDLLPDLHPNLVLWLFFQFFLQFY